VVRNSGRLERVIGASVARALLICALILFVFAAAGAVAVPARSRATSSRRRQPDARLPAVAAARLNA
jgi:hypothetical protein